VDMSVWKDIFLMSLCLSCLISRQIQNVEFAMGDLFGIKNDNDNIGAYFLP
jgi:hypothetical protein